MSATQANTRFAICVNDAGSEDLQKGKVYLVLSEANTERDGFLRVVDDSGEDYSQFTFVTLPRAVTDALLGNA